MKNSFFIRYGWYCIFTLFWALIQHSPAFSAPGDDCADPVSVHIPSQLPYQANPTTTCGRGDTIHETCLGRFDDGQDIVYELIVSAAVTIDIALSTDAAFVGLGVDDECPPDSIDCLAFTNSGEGGDCSLEAISLSPGAYYIVIDSWPEPDCIPELILALSGSTIPPSPTPCPCCPVVIDTFPYAEDFESGLGFWYQASDDDFDWTRRSEPTDTRGTGPCEAASMDYYIYIEASSPNYPGKSAALYSPCFDFDELDNARLTFWSHMEGEGIGTLLIECSLDDCATWEWMYELVGEWGDEWEYSEILLPEAAGRVKFRITGITGANQFGDIALDGITVLDISSVSPTPTATPPAPSPTQDPTVTQTPCCSVIIDSFPYAESFEDGLGHWRQDSADDFDWTLSNGPTESAETGPDHAFDGDYFMFTESSWPNNPAKTAILEGPCFDIQGLPPMELRFRSHLYLQLYDADSRLLGAVRRFKLDQNTRKLFHSIRL